LASSNAHKLKNNLAGILDGPSLDRIDAEIRRNVQDLFQLGLAHAEFARSLDGRHWRQIISRLYYAAYNMTRAVRLSCSGDYSRESDEHKKVGTLPAGFPDHATYMTNLPILRDDRNTCDYDHCAQEDDLVIPRVEAAAMVQRLEGHVREFLAARGVDL
jgi:hypothetical protein